MFSMKHLLIAVLAVAWIQSVGAQQPTLTVVDACEVLHDPARFNGKVVAIRGINDPEAHGAYLKADGCEGVLPNDRFKWQPVIFVSLSENQMASKGRDVRTFVRASEQLAAAIRSQVQLKGNGAKIARVKLTYVGLFETRADIAKRPGDGFGPLNAAPAQMYVDEVRDVLVEFE
jgi:hypothetical protein